jgi:hypothetical protein
MSAGFFSGKLFMPIAHRVVGQIVPSAIFGTAQTAFCRSIQMGFPVSSISGLSLLSLVMGNLRSKS